ncbi:hypothetical protein AQ490_08185 [Wenjunlia vitaminophila]|uniref:Uncharacterized protein n=1 Tax=Wenjunlia vitaminophila TaxID=76728 RepID=A0A0T6LNJ7_WENVI|nr:hypothetical protein AQ490_08185 [Wenjunlia vitaminophila]
MGRGGPTGAGRTHGPPKRSDAGAEDHAGAVAVADAPGSPGPCARVPAGAAGTPPGDGVGVPGVPVPGSSSSTVEVPRPVRPAACRSASGGRVPRSLSIAARAPV